MSNKISYEPISLDDCSKYSVLMSVYKNDKPEYLQPAIDSMLKQTVAPEQFVIVEDGPIPSELDKMIEDYAQKKPNLFTVVRLEKNGGLGNALNQGMKECRNELVARMDADDISKETRCERQLQEYRKYPNIGILGTQIEEFIGTPDNVVSKRIVPIDHEDIVKFSKRRSPFNHPTVMFRKSVIDLLHGYNACGRKEDLILFVRATHEGVYTRNLPESLLFYRTGEDNLKRRKTWLNCKEYIQVMADFYKKGYIGISDMAYVVVGQIVMLCTPDWLAKVFSDRLLRSK